MSREEEKIFLKKKAVSRKTDVPLPESLPLQRKIF